MEEDLDRLDKEKKGELDARELRPLNVQIKDAPSDNR
jgi:hypothetical protein